MLNIGIPKEIYPEERRVAAVPETVAKLVKAGMAVMIEAGAGAASYIADTAYQEAGATLVANSRTLFEQSNIIMKVNRPTAAEVASMSEATTLIAPLYPLQHLDLVTQLNTKKITCFALDLLPRIARTQAMDILSAMSNIAGYKSVIMAAEYLPKLFPMLTTAAGTITPAKVIVIGAGVAGLQAIATARRLGGVVLAFDTRPVTAEQVKSLGAEFVSLETSQQQAEDAGGYAKQQSHEFYQHEQEIIAKYLKDADVVITTALIPGKPAPRLISAAMVASMKPGAVIVDLAAEQQGNCELTQNGKMVVEHGITIIGVTNLPSQLSAHASQLFSRCLYNFVNYLAASFTTAQFDMSDEVIKNCLVMQQGKIVHTQINQALSQG